MKLFTWIALAAAAITPLYAQTDTLPDCRQPNLVVGEQCVYHGTVLPTQVYLGDIVLSGNQHVHMTSPVPPVGASAIAPAVTGTRAFDVGAFFTVQSETLGYKEHVSDGYKLTAHKQWSDWRGLEVRGTIVRSGWGKVGLYSGDNHTEAIAAGPRIQHSFGRVSPYGEALIGALYQYAPGMSESGVAGVEVRLNRRFSFVPAEGEYRYASLQDSSRTENPRRGRIEFEAGLIYHFGS